MQGGEESTAERREQSVVGSTVAERRRENTEQRETRVFFSFDLGVQERKREVKEYTEREEEGFMSEGFGLVVIGAAQKQLWQSSITLFLSIFLFFICMLSFRSSKKVSGHKRRKGLLMHLLSKRFFFHIQGNFFLFLFFRGAHT